MNAPAIRQGISYVTNSKGEKTALQLDLTNAAVQEIVEELIDTLDALERRNEPTRPFNDVKMKFWLVVAYNIVITESATKELTKVPVRMQDRIFDKIERLADEPKPTGCKKLKNFDVPGSDHDEYYRIRIGDYRVIYAIEKEQITIFVMKIAHRKDVYE